MYLNVLCCDRTATECTEVTFLCLFPQSSFLDLFPAFSSIPLGSGALFWIFPYDSYLSILILNSFLVSVCYPFVLHHQTIIAFSTDSINQFCVTAAGDIPF